MLSKDLLASSFVARSGYLGMVPTTVMTIQRQLDTTKEAMMGRKLRVILQIYFLCGTNGGYGHMINCCCYLN